MKIFSVILNAYSGSFLCNSLYIFIPMNRYDLLNPSDLIAPLFNFLTPKAASIPDKNH